MLIEACLNNLITIKRETQISLNLIVGIVLACFGAYLALEKKRLLDLDNSKSNKRATVIRVALLKEECFNLFLIFKIQ